jgi:hypothetical protein
MNKNRIIIFSIVGILLASSLMVAVDFAAAQTSSVQNPIANRILSASWVRINGIIKQWGTTDVQGLLQTQARAATNTASIQKSLTSATAMWTTNITREIAAVRTKENFTYVYYVARLPNASISTATVNSATDYALTGTWNLANITSTITIITDENGGIVKVHRDQDITTDKAAGVLTITGSTFTLSIIGMDQLTGPVYRSITRAWYNPFKMTDDSTISTVTKSDVNVIAQNYGAMPGWGNFDPSMDFNNNFRVDIADISTVAAQM